MRNEIILKFDGSLSPNKNVALRTLAYTLPHLQRAIDKSVYFHERHDLRKYTSLPDELQPLAALYIHEVQIGSFKIPFISELLKGVPELFTEFMAQPYAQAANDVKLVKGILKVDLGVAKGHAQLDNLEERTQEDMIKDEQGRKIAFARSAVLHDVNTMLSVVRGDQAAFISLDTDTERYGYRNFEFNQERAVRFNRITNTKRLADAVVYTGKIKGVEEQKARSQFRYSAKFLSSTTGQESKLLIADLEDAQRINAHNLKDVEVQFWGAPIALYEAFDPVRGDVVFIDFTY
ncbi:hypothetical protein H2N78_04405 [Pseudomonas aeruginosa]|uniref:hypothetical protein n=1 Tax=Pseudomonas aeruginosa TaxID=287 RepID=UPI0015F0BB15|nr:hypothetical protein [Pseudomonas aeruginosa]MBA5116479.1 hypothetical protein [Pseudomonas aeruginosa]